MFADSIDEMTPRIKAHLSLLAVNLIYGINYSMAKMVMPYYVQPYGFVLLRVIVSLPMFALFSYFVIKEKIKAKDIPRFLLLGVFGVAANQMLFLKGLDMTTPINAAIIMTSNPVLVLFLAAMMLGERISFSKITGIILGVAGAWLLIGAGKTISFGSSTMTGDICIFFNSLSWALFIVLTKPLMERYHAMTVITWVFASGIFYVAPFGYDEFLSIRWSEMEFSIWLAIGFVVIMSTFVTYFLNTFALRSLNATTVSYYIYLQPVLAAVMAIWMGQEEITVIQCVAAVFTFAGIFMISNGGGRKY